MAGWNRTGRASAPFALVRGMCDPDGGSRLKRLILCGGGHSHLEVLRVMREARRADALSLAGVELVLVDPESQALYSGMLPGHIAGHYAHDEVHIDLDRLAAAAGGGRVPWRATGLDPTGRNILLENGTRLEFDLLSLDIGSALDSSVEILPGARALRVRPIGEFVRAWPDLLGQAANGGLRRLLVVGAGAAGVELLLAMHHALRSAVPGQEVALSLACETEAILPGYPARVRVHLQRALRAASAYVHSASRVLRVEPGGVRTAAGTFIEADAVILATGAAPPSAFDALGLARDVRGFFLIDERLRSMSHDRIYAAGDCASFAGEQVPKSGVYAVRQGPPLARNLRAAIEGRQPSARYRPQARALSLISSGDRSAVATRGGISIAGPWAWRWKDWIDRRFMARYRV